MTRDRVDEMAILQRIQADLGGLVELVIVGTTVGDWMEAVAALSESGFDVSVYDSVRSLTFSMDPVVFAQGEDSPYAIGVDVGNQVWTASLRDPSLISLQCDAEDFRTVEDVREIKRLMSVVSGAVGKESILSPESAYPGQMRPYLTVNG